MFSHRIRNSARVILSMAALLPATAFAGTPTVIVNGFTPTVPTMSQNMMIALGVLLAVVGLRFLKQYGSTQKMLSLLLVGGGLALGAFGVDKTQATDAGFSDGGSACGGAQESQAIRDPIGGGTLFNSCSETTLTVVAYTGYPCSSSEQIKANADVGDTIPPGGTATLNRCPAPD